jgi:hypothetical protein
MRVTGGKSGVLDNYNKGNRQQHHHHCPQIFQAATTSPGNVGSKCKLNKHPGNILLWVVHLNSAVNSETQQYPLQ